MMEASDQQAISLQKSPSHDTTVAETLVGNSTIEDGQNNTTMFRSLHES